MSEGRNTELVSELRDRLDKRRAALKDEVARGWTDKFENAADWATLTVPFNELAAVFDALESTSRALSEKEGELTRLAGLLHTNGTPRFNEAMRRAETATRQRDEALAALKASEEREVQKLVWDETFVDRGDGAQDHSGWEAPNGFGLYYTIEMYFGSDSYGWQVEYDGRVISDHDNPEAAKASAQRHFEGMVRAALVRNLADATKKDPGTEQREAGNLLRAIETLPDDFTDDGNCCAGKLKEPRNV